MSSESLATERQAGRAVGEARAALAAAVTERHYALNPELERRFGQAGREKCLQDANYHLSYLAESLGSALPALFADYVAWAKVMLEARGVPAKDLARNLEVLRDVLRERLPAEEGELAARYVEEGIKRLPHVAPDLPAFVSDAEPHAALARGYIEALLAGRRHEASRLVLEAVEEGVGVRDVYLHVFQRAQREVGRLWQLNLLSVAQEHYCTAATQLVMSQLYPRIFSTERNGRTLVATCVAGDLHEIGLRMVADFFEMEGWDTFYVGANAPAASVVQAIAERDADVLAVSATITSHVRALRELIAAVRAERETRHVKVLAGGYPFNVAPGLWREVGADASARDAAGAVEAATRLAEGGAA
ncbi:MAG: cobalamin-dependent protein [Acidobacteria bacterium]|nr:cobalamin-dependent protein [Acidobacteriota bacterium]